MTGSKELPLGVLPGRPVHGTLVLVRRGRLDPLEDQKVLGHSDPTLSEAGVQAERELLRRLKALTPKKVLASDLLRSRVTADRLSMEQDLPIAVRRDLREQRLGAWEGRLWSEVIASEEEAAVRFLSNFCEEAPPKGESLPRVQERVTRALLAECRRLPRETLVYIGHAGPIRAFLATVMGIPLPAAQRIELSPFGISVVRLIGRSGIVSALNVPADDEGLGLLPH